MDHCRDCKHFKVDERGVGFPNVDKHALVFQGRCERANGDDGGPEDPQTLAFALDVEGYAAFLRVSPDFGCIQFEPKPRLE